MRTVSLDQSIEALHHAREAERGQRPARLSDSDCGLAARQLGIELGSRERELWPRRPRDAAVEVTPEAAAEEPEVAEVGSLETGERALRAGEPDLRRDVGDRPATLPWDHPNAPSVRAVPAAPEGRHGVAALPGVVVEVVLARARVNDRVGAIELARIERQREPRPCIGDDAGQHGEALRVPRVCVAAVRPRVVQDEAPIAPKERDEAQAYRVRPHAIAREQKVWFIRSQRGDALGVVVLGGIEAKLRRQTLGYLPFDAVVQGVAVPVVVLRHEGLDEGCAVQEAILRGDLRDQTLFLSFPHARDDAPEVLSCFECVVGRRPSLINVSSHLPSRLGPPP